MAAAPTTKIVGNCDAPASEDYCTFFALSFDAACCFRRLLSFDNASSFLAAHA
jgi:hypothetical protein